MIITMGLSKIVQLIVNTHNLMGIVECAPRKSKQKKENIIYKIFKNLYHFFKKIETLEVFSKDKNIPYYYMNNGSDATLENWINFIKPDVIEVYSMSQLLKKNIFNIPKYGTINFHPALLLSYRGPFPDFWMYYNTERKGGVTVHYIDKGEDTGDIIYQEKYDISLGMKSPAMLDLAIGQIGVKLLLKELRNIKDLPRIKQPKKSPTKKAKNIKVTEHKNIIDWQELKIERIWHILRGTELWLDAIEQPFGLQKGQRWSIGEYEKCSVSKEYKVSNVYKENGRTFIACNDGKIYLYVKFDIKKFILRILGK